MSEQAAALREQVARELGRPAPPAALALARTIVARHGPEVAAVLFYGSCLRKQTHEGVLDFYVLVDDYRSVHDRLWLAAANALLPPNVFYLETEAELGPARRPETVRCKYAVLATYQLEYLVSPRCLHPYIWARFAQPCLLAYARDEAAREQLEQCVAQSVVTFVQRLTPLVRAQGQIQRFSMATLWQQSFRRTYGTELRSESEETIRSLYESQPERFDAVARGALGHLAAAGTFDAFSSYSSAAEVYQSSARRWAARARWYLGWPIAKTLAVLRLAKTAFTFQDWLPYVLWKLERQSGLRIEATERQRRHPLIFGWPVIFRLLGRRAFH